MVKKLGKSVRVPVDYIKEPKSTHEETCTSNADVKTTPKDENKINCDNSMITDGVVPIDSDDELEENIQKVSQCGIEVVFDVNRPDDEKLCKLAT